MGGMSTKEKLINELAASLESDLFNRFGPIMGGEDLQKALGYVSKAALQQSMVRNTVPVPIFDIENRRGKFALVKDVAQHLAEQRYNNVMECE